MGDIYQSTLNKYKGSPSAVILFIAAFLMFVIGMNHFIEDTNSSKLGLEGIERAYQLNVQIFQWSYWTMSLAPQIASIVFMYMYLSDTSKKGYLGLSAGFQIIDFMADSWYRSNGNLFHNAGATVISGILTFIYFSVGSEFFIATGGGLLLKLTAPALATWKQAWRDISAASNGRYGGGGSGGGGGGKPEQGKQNNQHQGRGGGQDRRAQLESMYHGPDRRKQGGGEQHRVNRFEITEEDE